MQDRKRGEGWKLEMIPVIAEVFGFDFKEMQTWELCKKYG